MAATTNSAIPTVASPEESRQNSNESQESVLQLPRCKNSLLGWRIAGGLLAFLVVLGWIFIIVMLILEEKWQLVLVAWLLLYSAAHFCYWYCKRHSLITLHRQIRLRVHAHSRNPENGAKSDDGPPSYEEVIKTEAPPPAYFTVVSENYKPGTVAFTPCVPTGTFALSTCSQKVSKEEEAQQKQKKNKKAKRTNLTLEIRDAPPAYQSPRSPRALSPRILPAVHEAGGSLVTATAAATAAATATAAFSYLSNTATEEVQPIEDPIRCPIVQHLKSATMPTLEVSSNVDVSNGVASLDDDIITNDILDQIEAMDVNRSSIL